MAGLGLTSAVQSLQQGLAWREQKDESDRIKKQRASIDAANKAGADVLTAAQTAWEKANPAPEASSMGLDGKPAAAPARQPWRATDEDMFAAAEARGSALANAGMWKEWTENRAQLVPMQMSARARAFEQFKIDGDEAKLAAATYPTMFDGKRIVKQDMLDGTGPDGTKAPPKMRFQLSDGTTQIIEPGKVASAVQRSLVDPKTFAELEMKSDFARALKDYEAQKAADLEDRRHKNNVNLEGVRSGYRKEEIGLRGEQALSLADARQEGAVEVANIRAGATLGAARTRASGGSGGSASGGAGQRVQRTMTDADGNTVLVFRDGRTELAKIDGKPVRAGEFGKRVDSLAKSLRSTPDFIGKPEADVRQAAMDALTKPGLPAAAPAPGPGLDSPPAPGGRPPLSSFLTR